jgi:exodeoxyribonuclease VIII
MATIHAMADFETLGVRPTSAVLSLGAVAFNSEGVLEDTFYVNIDSADCINLGLTTDQSTIDWWEKQSAEAKAALDNDKKSLLEAMTLFCSWVRRTKCETLWGCGADFDNPILRNIFGALDADFPFKPWAGRCYRTIKHIPGAPKMPKRVGTHHNALDDAMSQALHLIEINKHIRVLE